MFGLSIDVLFSPTAMVVLLSVVMLFFVGFLLYREFKPQHLLLLFNEIERLYETHLINNKSPEAFYTKDNIRVFRTAPAYKHPTKNRTISLGKVGTGYLFKPEDTPEGTGIKLGSIWEGLKVILGANLVNQFSDEVKEILMSSKVFLAVDLERGTRPTKNDGSENEYPIVNEQNIKASVLSDVSQLIFGGIASALKEREWLRDIGLIGTGVALKYLAESLGIIS